MTFLAHKKVSYRIFGKEIRPKGHLRFSGNGQKSPNNFGKNFQNITRTRKSRNALAFIRFPILI